MTDSDQFSLTLTLDGPLVEEHRLSLSELVRVAKQLRLTVKNIATVLAQRGPSGQSGRSEQFIEASTDLRVVGQPVAGSFQLELEVPPARQDNPEFDADFGPTLAERSVTH